MTKLVCVDDNPDITAMLSAKINSQPGLKCVRCFHDANSFLEYLARADGRDGVIRLSDDIRTDVVPDVVVIDWAMPGLSASEAIRKIRDTWPRVRPVVYSAHHSSVLTDQALDAGAWGCLSKSDGLDALVDAIRSVIAGEMAFSNS
jgi:DNA-binding NarL/FixJ family response regulator